MLKSVKMPPLHAAQQEIYDSMLRFTVLACGRRFGKSMYGSAWLMEGALSMPSNNWWVAPTYKMSSVAWRLLKHLANQIPGTRKSEVERRIELPTGGNIEVRSADDPDSLRSEGLDRLVMDECAFIREAAWAEALRPALSDREGRALFVSTPKGRNWFWRLYCQKDGDQYQALSYPTSANPHIKPREIEAARVQMPDRLFRQEYLAEFIEDAGSVFRNVAELSTLRPLEGPEEGRQYFGGVDWGKHTDFTAIAIYDDLKRQVYLDRFNKVDYVVQINRIANLHKRFGMSQIVVETNSVGEPNLERMQRDGLPVVGFNTTNRSKAAAVEAFEAALDHREVHLLDDETQISELQALEATKTASGLTRYAAPEGMHDDTVIANILAFSALLTGPTFKTYD